MLTADNLQSTHSRQCGKDSGTLQRGNEALRPVDRAVEGGWQTKAGSTEQSKLLISDTANCPHRNLLQRWLDLMTLIIKQKLDQEECLALGATKAQH